MMTRKTLTVLVAALLVSQVVVAPVAAIPFVGSNTDTPDVVQSDGTPTFVVTLDDESSLSKLEDWANATDTRRVLSTSANGSVATIRAPGWQVNQGLLDRVLSSPSKLAALRTTPLYERGYVARVDLNYQLSNAAPLDYADLLNASAFTAPDVNPFGIRDPSLPTEGVAFKADANRTTMTESRQYLGVDNVSATGQGVTVAVIDSGVNTAGGQLFGDNESSSTPDRLLAASKSFISNETVAANGTDAVEDANGHGTWVASSIAANASNDTHDGIAPDANVLALKALDSEGSGSTSDIARAIRYAADHDADVVTMSLGSPVHSQALADAREYAFNNGVKAITVAAGNSRQTVRWVASPSDTEGVIAVAATNGSEPPTAGSAYFSQIGPDPGTTDGSNLATQGEMPNVAAPGMQTVALTADTSGFTSTEALSGTSMATPMVAGSITLALEANPSWDAPTVREQIEATSRRVPNAAEVEVGAGMVAADRLTTQDTTKRTQSEAMTDAATARGEFYRALSDSAGGLVGRFLNGGSIL